MNKNKQTILFVIPTLGHGGAQRVLTALMEYMCESSNESNDTTIHLLTFRKETDPIHRPHSKVRLNYIDVVSSKSASFIKIITAPRKLRIAIKRINPTVIISFQDIANFPTILANFGLGIPLIVAERNDPKHYRLARARAIARSALYPFANSIVVQTINIANQMPSRTNKITTLIPNAVPTAPHQASPANPKNHRYTIVSAGRLEQQKDHALLIDAFAATKPKNHSWELKIYGEGSLRNSLEKRIRDLDLKTKASIEFATDNIYKALENSHLFVLSSAHEGFPNILAEAVATGLPSIGYQSVSGVPELIHHSKNGLLLSDTQRNKNDLANAMLELMNDAEKRVAMGKNCKEIAIKFQPDTINKTWSSLILQHSRTTQLKSS